MRAGLVTRICGTAASGAVTVAPMPAGRGVAPLADVPDRQRRDGFSQLVIRRKHPVIAVPVLPRRRDEVRQTIEKLKWREFDDAVGPRPRGLAAAAGADPVGGPDDDPVSGQHVADADDPVVWAADHGESLKGERGPGTVSQQVFEAPKVARHITVDERDPDTRIDGKPAVLPGEHVGGGGDVEQALHAEPPDHAAADPLGEPARSAWEIGRAGRNVGGASHPA